MPDPKQLYFPTGVLVSAGGRALYVANSDFDLKYAGGSVQALDAPAVRDAVRVIPEILAEQDGRADAACAAAGRGRNADPWLYPGPCSPFDVAPFVRASAFIGAFASGLALAHDPEQARARLFVPVRGDPSITFFEVDDDRDPAATGPHLSLACGVGADGFCDAAHRVGQDRDRSLRGIQLPADPVGIAVSADGVAVVSAHQTQQAASLVTNDWSQAPVLSYFASNLPNGPTEVVAIPEPALVPLGRAAAASAGRAFSYQSAFAVTFRSAAEVDVLLHYPDSGSVPPRPFLVRSQALPVTVNASNFDSRGIAIVATERRRCEAACAPVPDPLACAAACAETIPLRIYMANRAPASLLIGRVETVVDRGPVDGGAEGDEVIVGAYDTLTFHDSVPLDFGASRVEVGKVVAPSGELVDRVFAVCFDARALFVLDPATERVEMVVHTGRGPHDIAVDSGYDATGEPYSWLYVGHFTDSYLGVVDLDGRRPQSYGEMIATVGVPSAPRESG
jgi:hypothetical protein